MSISSCVTDTDTQTHRHTDTDTQTQTQTQTRTQIQTHTSSRTSSLPSPSACVQFFLRASKGYMGLGRFSDARRYLSDALKIDGNSQQAKAQVWARV